MRGKALVGGARLKRLSFAATAAVMLFSIFIAVPFVFFPEKAEAAITLRSSTTNSATPCNAGLTINKPSGVIVGDVMVAQIASDGGALSTPSGWATIDNASYHSGNIRMATFFRIIEGTEGSNFTFPVGTSTSCIGGIMAFEGVDNGQVIDNAGAARNTDSNTGATVSVPSLTTASANTMLVASMVKSSGATSNNFTAIAGGTESYDFGLSGSLAVAGDYGNYVGPGTISGLTSTISSANWAVHFVALKPATVHMLLFWDGNTAPPGWTFVNSFNGRFIRGDSSANYGLIGGSSTHQPTATVSVGNASGAQLTNNSNTDSATYTHTHTGTVTIGTAANNPVNRTLKLISFNGGVPNIIPQNAIALFDSSPGIPSGWTRQSAFDNKYVKIDSTAGVDSGSNTHSHTITWSNLSASVGSAPRSFSLLGSAAAPPSHTHTVAATTTLTNGASAQDCEVEPVANQCLPQYVQVLLAKANANTPTLSIGLTAMFDGEPGGGWVVRSDTGGPYNQRFLRGGATYDEDDPGNPNDNGSLTHTHLNATTTSSANSGSTTGNTFLNIGSIAEQGHTHQVTATFNPANHSPEYFNVVIAEKVNFILDGYRWYEDTNNEVVSSSNEWSVLNVPESNPILTIPAAYNPPVPGTELRLRVRVIVNNNSLAAHQMQFKLQYKEGTDGNCTTDVWTDVDASGGGGVWRYASSSVPDGTPLSTSVLSSTVRQLYVRSSSAGTNPNVVNPGESMEWDFHIENNGAPGAAQFSFRLVEDTGILLSQYTYCPTLSTKPDTENLLRHGNFFESGSEKGFLWVD